MSQEGNERLWAGDERREWPRFTPTSQVPVMFEHPRAPGLGAGHIVDVSTGGCRIIAPPTTTTPLRWGEAVILTVSYSEGTRQARAEGIEYEAVVMEVVSNSTAFVVRCRFVQALSDRELGRLAGILEVAA